MKITITRISQDCQSIERKTIAGDKLSDIWAEYRAIADENNIVKWHPWFISDMED